MVSPTNKGIPLLDSYTGRVAGPMRRTVADVAAAMTALSKPDPRDWSALPYEEIYWEDLDIDVARLRIGVSFEPTSGLRATPEVEAIVSRAVGVIRSSGAVIEEIPPYFSPSDIQSWITLLRALLGAAKRPGGGRRSVPGAPRLRARRRRGHHPDAALEVMRGIDGVQ